VLERVPTKGKRGELVSEEEIRRAAEAMRKLREWEIEQRRAMLERETEEAMEVEEKA